MTKIQQTPGKSKIAFEGAVGRGPLRQTLYGTAIDVVDPNRRPQRCWYDVVPDDPKALCGLRPGDWVKIEGYIVHGGARPIVRGTITRLA